MKEHFRVRDQRLTNLEVGDPDLQINYIDRYAQDWETPVSYQKKTTWKFSILNSKMNALIDLQYIKDCTLVLELYQPSGIIR